MERLDGNARNRMNVMNNQSIKLVSNLASRPNRLRLYRGGAMYVLEELEPVL